MTNPSQPTEYQLPRLPNPAQLTAQTQAFADQIFNHVSEQYLQFRRIYYHESDPSIATVPTPYAASVQDTAGKLADQALRAFPKVLDSLPVIRDIFQHLQRVADIHSLTEEERVTLHNVTLVFLHGIQGGIQAWYAESLLENAYRLAHIEQFDYYIWNPWDGLFYQTPEELQAFTGSVRNGDIPAIQREIERKAQQIGDALQDPLKAQRDLAFSGPHGERHKLVFDLKTSAGLALGAYLAVEALEVLVRPHQDGGRPASVVQLIPAALNDKVVTPEPNSGTGSGVPSPQ